MERKPCVSNIPKELLDSFRGPQSKCRSCTACRKAKTRCQGETADGPSYPCSRCVRLKLVCEDPQAQAPDDTLARMGELNRALLRRLEADPPVDRDRAERLLGLSTLIYERKILTKDFKADGNVAYGLDVLIRALLRYLSMDENAYMESLNRLDGPDGVMIEGTYYTHQGARLDNLHPFCLELFDETRSTIALVSIRGEHRILCNASFSNTFFSEEDANRWYRDEEVPVPSIMAIPMHTEKTRIARTMCEVLVDACAPCTELRQIYKVRLMKMNVAVMALVRMRFVMLQSGAYMATSFSFSPLPMHAAPSKRVPQGARRTTLQCPMESDVWLEAAELFGEWDETPVEQIGRQLHALSPNTFPPESPTSTTTDEYSLGGTTTSAGPSPVPAVGRMSPVGDYGGGSSRVAQALRPLQQQQQQQQQQRQQLQQPGQQQGQLTYMSAIAWQQQQQQQQQQSRYYLYQQAPPPPPPSQQQQQQPAYMPNPVPVGMAGGSPEGPSQPPVPATSRSSSYMPDQPTRMTTSTTTYSEGPTAPPRTSTSSQSSYMPDGPPRMSISPQTGFFGIGGVAVDRGISYGVWDDMPQLPPQQDQQPQDMQQSGSSGSSGSSGNSNLSGLSNMSMLQPEDVMLLTELLWDPPPSPLREQQEEEEGGNYCRTSQLPLPPAVLTGGGGADGAHWR